MFRRDGIVSIDAETDALKALAKALGREADGKQLRKDLAADMRKALEPGRDLVRSSIAAMPSTGATKPGLRAAIAKKVVAEARLTGRSTGARIRAKRKGYPRGFDNAPKRLNSKKGWRHKVYGRDVWVQQVGKPEWFDEPLRKEHDRYRLAVRAAMEKAAKRIAERAR